MRKISSSPNQRRMRRRQVTRRAEIVAERLLDDHPRPAGLARAPLPDLPQHRLERLRRHGQVVHAIAGRAPRAVELGEHVADAVLAAIVREVGGARSGCLPRATPTRRRDTGSRACSLTPVAQRRHELRASSAPCARRRRPRSAPAAGAGRRASTGPGSSLRRVRSPDAPKMTSAHGSGRRRSPRPSASGFERARTG